eukprot:gnl/TRDRNA2_/TRDRNA2_151797_c0_seq4.p1 gnl/TRDRNA2_/TRDRNA2_151797_c0~~gnl/TRDRNA2_/TRDRNA2_151797_c0_seq4.p1  ORF type:complete len:346 (-),score=42.51 gnl/TRDRNA2_/TRDRNA2_151797_c0_seq4:158-1135(-)
MGGYAEELLKGLPAILPHEWSPADCEALSDGSASSASRCRWKSCRPGCCLASLESMVSLTHAEARAHRQLSKIASIDVCESDPKHEEDMEAYWRMMLGEDAPYEARSPRWSDDLGFQGENPWRDFRGGGLLALRCLCFMAERHNEMARTLASEAKYSTSTSWYPFSAACIGICQMLAVHLRLNGRPAMGPVRNQAKAHALALKRFTRDLMRSEPVEVFAQLFVATLRKFHHEWLTLCSEDPTVDVITAIPEVYESIGKAVEMSLLGSNDPCKALFRVNTSSSLTTAKIRLRRSESILLVTMLRIRRLCSIRRRYRGPAEPMPPSP